MACARSAKREVQNLKKRRCRRVGKSFLLLFFKKEGLAFFLSLVLLGSQSKAATSTFSAVQARKSLTCAVVTEAFDWNKEDLHGSLAPLDIEICRAIAVAALGRDDALSVVRAPAETEALAALRAGQADLAVGVTPAISTGLQLGVAYGPPVFWDSQAIMVHRQSSIRDLAALAGKTVCFIDGTDVGKVLLVTMQARNIAVRPFPFQEEGEMEAAFSGGHCQAISAYASKLAEMRKTSPGGRDFVLLPDRLAMSPAVVATRAGDLAWSALVAATLDVLVQAEMLGVTRAGVAQAARSDDPVLSRLLGRDWSSGLALGLSHDWSAKVISAVGNYGEIYGRTLGAELPAGVNSDCLHGGVLCAGQVR